MFHDVAQPQSVLLALLFSAAVCRPSWITQQTPTMSASCLASLWILPLYGTQQLTPDDVDPKFDPTCCVEELRPLQNSPTMPLQGVPGSHLHCFGEAEVLI